MVAAQTHRFTVSDYHRMAETGILEPRARVELIEGEIVDILPIGPFHSGSGYRLIRHFSRLAAGRWLVASQGPLRIDKHNEPEPDLMLLRPAADDYTQNHPTPEDVFLLIEIADSSLDFDRKTKLPLYARAGIAEVWILNLPQKQLEVYRQPHRLEYETQSIHTKGEVAPAAFPDAVLAVETLLD